MKRTLLLNLLILSFVGYSQNWNVFNKSYRYNYKFNNSQLVSNVLFVDSVKQTGQDTTYYMNRIGVVTGNTLQIDQPQFLMKKIIKDVNWNVSLVGPESLFIIPTCTLNQAWQFDNVNSMTATCVAITTVNIFNTVDSIKKITVNNIDTIIISKQFGILQFPKLYGQNKYYRLVGIENKEIYETNAVFGEKVLNAWDIFDRNVGDKYRTNQRYLSGGTSPHSGCLSSTVTILAKITTTVGYVFIVDGKYKQISGNNPYYGDYCTMPASVMPNYNPPVTTFSTINTQDLRYDSILPNKMYPGMVVNDGDMYNVVFFGLDNVGTFYKYLGASPCQSTLTILPGANAPIGFVAPTATSTILTISNYGSSIHFGDRLGMVSNGSNNFEYDGQFCTLSAVKNGVEYFGPWETPVNDIGLRERSSPRDLLLFPNPARSQLHLSFDNGCIKLYDPFGKLVREEILVNKEALDISNIPNGLYFLEIQTDSFKSTQKLIIQH